MNICVSIVVTLIVILVILNDEHFTKLVQYTNFDKRDVLYINVRKDVFRDMPFEVGRVPRSAGVLSFFGTFPHLNKNHIAVFYYLLVLFTQPVTGNGIFFEHITKLVIEQQISRIKRFQADRADMLFECHITFVHISAPSYARMQSSFFARVMPV